MLFFAELVIPTKIGLTCAFIPVPKSGVKIKILGWPRRAPPLWSRPGYRCGGTWKIISISSKMTSDGMTRNYDLPNLKKEQ